MKTKYFKKIEFKESLIELSNELIAEKTGLKPNEIKNINIHVTDNYIVIEYEKTSPPFPVTAHMKR